MKVSSTVGPSLIAVSAGISVRTGRSGVVWPVTFITIPAAAGSAASAGVIVNKQAKTAADRPHRMSIMTTPVSPRGASGNSTILAPHGRACPGHPRLFPLDGVFGKDVDG